MNSARTLRICWLVIGLLVTTHSVWAMLRVYFDVPRASWAASHIVLAKTTGIEGTFEVVESWKGDLSPGSRVVIPELIPPPNASPLSGYSGDCAKERCRIQAQIPKQPLGSRIVLFLRRNKVEPQDGTGPKGREWSGWFSTHDTDEMKISTVWIEGNNTYSFQKGGFLGEYFILSIRGDWSNEDRHFVAESEEDLKRGVAKELQKQKEMEAIVAETSGRERALRLKPWVNSKSYPARRFALEELSRAGPDAVSTIGEMLDDPAYSEQASELVKAMVKAGGKSAGEELNRHLERDLAFWTSIGPLLSENWWNEDTTPSSPLRNRYDQTYSLLYGLTQVDYQGGLNNVTKLRDLWRSLPWLDASGDNQMVEACDKLIQELQTN